MYFRNRNDKQTPWLVKCFAMISIVIQFSEKKSGFILFTSDSILPDY